LVELLRSPEASQLETNLAEKLVEESLARNGRDNITALVVRVV